ncbi:MAG: hypothetical protein NW215_14935 [Hyphomicrobiales bacterium]|nr:hypothetical protein [Hyphomicrobiales bacterium]
MTLPTNDILLDVAAAADPVRAQEARAKLAAQSRPAERALGQGAAFKAPFSPTVPPTPGATPIARPEPAPLARFERFVAQTFIEAMLPAADGGWLGGGAGAKVWRSFLAEALAERTAASFGLARSFNPQPPKEVNDA